DPELHAQTADILIRRVETVPDGEAEAYAAKVLAPANALAWRRWALVLALESRQEESIAAIDHYFQLMPVAASREAQTIRLRAIETRMLPGGDLAQRSMKKELNR